MWTQAVFVKKKKLHFHKFPDTCGRGLNFCVCVTCSVFRLCDKSVWRNILVFASVWLVWFFSVWGFLIPLIALSLDGVFRACFAVGFSPFYIRFHLVGPFRCPFCFRPRRAKNLVSIFARKSRLILFSGAVGKGKGLALQARIPRLTWFPLLCGFCLLYTSPSPRDA